MRAALGLLLALGAAAGVAAPASAHSTIVSSNPADGARLEQAPSRLELRMSEGVEAAATHLVLVDSAGHRTELGPVHVAAASASADTEEPVTITAPMPVLAKGTYRVDWRTVSSDDLHPTQGVLVFGLGVAAGSSGSDPREAGRPGEAAVRWALWTGLAGAVGALAVAALAGRGLTGCRRARVARVGRVGSLVLVVGVLLLPFVQVGSLRSAVVVLTSPGTPVTWSARVLAALLLAVLAHRVTRRPGVALGLGVGAAAVVATTGALRGHAGASGSATLVAVAALHALVATSWVGAVAALAVALAPAPEPVPRRVLRGFAWLAGGALVLTAATGVLLAGREVVSSAALVRSAYGRTLLVKVALVLLAVGLGVLNHRRSRRGVSGLQQGRRRVLVEAGALVLVLAAAGAVAASAPATGARWTPGPAPSLIDSDEVDGLVLDATISPNTPGRGFVTAHVLQARRPAPGPVTWVQVTLTSGTHRISAAATPQPDGQTWLMPVDLTAPGRWDLDVAVTRPGLPTAHLRAPWIVAGGAHGPPGTLLRPLSGPLALLVLVVGLVLLVLSARGGGRRRLTRGVTPAGSVVSSAGTPIVQPSAPVAAAASPAPAGLAPSSPAPAHAPAPARGT